MWYDVLLLYIYVLCSKRRYIRDKRSGHEYVAVGAQYIYIQQQQQQTTTNNNDDDDDNNNNINNNTATTTTTATSTSLVPPDNRDFNGTPMNKLYLRWTTPDIISFPLSILCTLQPRSENDGRAIFP